MYCLLDLQLPRRGWKNGAAGLQGKASSTGAIERCFERCFVVVVVNIIVVVVVVVIVIVVILFLFLFLLNYY